MPRPAVRLLAGASAALLALLTANAAVELTAWLVWQRSFAALEEIQAILVVWFGMVTAAYCLADGAHLAVDVVTARLRGRAARAVAVVPPAAVVAFGVLLALYGYRLVAAIGNTLPATGWSAAIQYQPVALVGIVIAALGAAQLVSPAANPDDPSPPGAA